MIDLSIILCTRNRVNILKKTLNSLDLEQMLAHNGELILVDSGSTDDTLNLLLDFQKKNQERIIVVPVSKPGLGLARNEGIHASSGQTFIFWDDDVYFKNNYLEIASKVFLDSKFSICGGRILPYDKNDSNYGCMYSTDFKLYSPDYLISPGQLHGMNLVVDRKVFDIIGLFDPDLGAGTRFRCEDIDFIARALLFGFSAAYVPELVVYHDHKRKPGDDIKKLRKANAIACGAFWAKMIFYYNKRSYLGLWIRSLRKKNPNKKENLIFREIYGALKYLGWIIFIKNK